MLVAASEGPPAPTDVVLLAEAGDVSDVLLAALLRLDTVDYVPLVHVHGHVVLVPESDGPLLEVVLVPVSVEPDIGIAIATWAVLLDPTLVETIALVRARIGINVLIEDVLVRIEVVERIDYVVDAVEIHRVGEKVELVVAAWTDHDRCDFIDTADSLCTFHVEIVDDLRANGLVSRLAEDLPSGDAIPRLVASDDMLPGSPEPLPQILRLICCGLEHILVKVVAAGAPLGPSGEDDPDTLVGRLQYRLVQFLEAILPPVWRRVLITLHVWVFGRVPPAHAKQTDSVESWSDLLHQGSVALVNILHGPVEADWPEVLIRLRVDHLAALNAQPERAGLRQVAVLHVLPFLVEDVIYSVIRQEVSDRELLLCNDSRDSK